MFTRALAAIFSGAALLLLTLTGVYLASTTHATLYGKSPVGSSFISELDAPTAAFLQQIAADTVAAHKPVSLPTGAK